MLRQEYNVNATSIKCTELVGVRFAWLSLGAIHIVCHAQGKESGAGKYDIL